MASATDPLVEWKEMMLVLQESTLARLFMGESAGVAVAVGEGKVNSTEQVEDANIKGRRKRILSHIGRIHVARVKQEHRGTDHAYYKSAHQIH